MFPDVSDLALYQWEAMLIEISAKLVTRHESEIKNK